MNKLWDDLKDNMKEWGASAVEKAEEISRVAVAKGEEFTKISKLKYDISQVQKDKAKIYEKLGRLVFEKTKNNNMANFTANKEFFGLVEEVDGLSNDIANKEVEIVNIKKEYGINDSDIEMNLDATIENSLQEEE
jgi:predicted  nucleic acid-binding Zn-ribbon protein